MSKRCVMCSSFRAEADSGEDRGVVWGDGIEAVCYSLGEDFMAFLTRPLSIQEHFACLDA